MAKTSIQWTDHSVNPIRFGKGHFCQKISPGCANCYASRLQPRFGNPEFGGRWTALPIVISNGVTNGQYLWLDRSKLKEVLARKKPTKYFWADMTDLFGEWVPDGLIDECFGVMGATPQHTHQVLTKRADRMLEYMRTRGHKAWNARRLETEAYPPRNVWLGVSVEDQPTADQRVPLLLATPAAVRFLSCEPLLGPVNLGKIAHPLNAAFPESAATFNCLTLVAESVQKSRRGGSIKGTVETGKVDWVITGCESGPKRRPYDVEWDRAIQRQCADAGVAFFRKQTIIAGRVSGDPSEWPEGLRVREFPPAPRGR